jgi:hypothetical protein
MATTEKQTTNGAGANAGPVFNIPVSGVGPKVGQSLRVPQHFRYDSDLATISNQAADSVAVIEVPCGVYTYRGFHLSLTNSAIIAGATFAVGSRNYVNTANFVTYISRVQLEIDGKIEQDFYIDELTDWNKVMHWDSRNGIASLMFGSPGIFKDDVIEDAYLLGTRDLRSVRILVTLKAAFPATMRLNCACEFSKVSRPVGYLVTMRRTRYASAAAGDFTVSDLPHGIDLAAVWIRNTAGVVANDVTLQVDTETVFNATSLEMQYLNAVWGKATNQLPATDILIDFWREQDGNKGLASLSLLEQIRRNAQIRLTLNFDQVNAAFYAITFHCGPYKMQR